MIRTLRRRHRLAWAVLAPILAALLAAALHQRPEPPLVDALPTPRHAQRPAPAETDGAEALRPPRGTAGSGGRETPAQGASRPGPSGTPAAAGSNDPGERP